jgi:hypothetical protein
VDGVSVVAPPRPPGTDRRADEAALDALIEEARRRARRRRQRYGAAAVLAALGGALALAVVRSGGDPRSQPVGPPTPTARPVTPDAVRNGPLTIAAVEAVGEQVGPSGWYGLSTIGPDGRLHTLVRCPDRARWCGEVESIDWSPDGRRLALSVSSVGLYNPYDGIRIIDLRTGQDRRIRGCNDPPGECDWFDLEWSPDGTKLAYVSSGNIVLIDADGSDRHLLRTGTEGSDTRPSWSPDGSSIAFGNSLDGRSSVYVVGVDGSNLRLLAERASTPAWSPLGTAIAYRTGCGIQLVSPAAPAAVPSCRNAIGVPGLGWPVWSPDGAKLAAAGTSRRGTGPRSGGTWVMNADGSELERVSDQVFSVSMGPQPRASWRPIPRRQLDRRS